MNDTRHLTKAYKASAPPMGVYAIRNRINQRYFLGASLNLDAAQNRHRFELGMRGHRSAALQRDWLAHGAEAFEFEVVDMVRPRSEPGIDYQAELDALLELWSAEFALRGGHAYRLGVEP
ncbi:GIY-YIG nuclease family protein [Oxalobacteraceae bacterium OM1]|nr:GIY-YIG nuclease family protein [Oxalobacteraceae bacterium OM1]